MDLINYERSKDFVQDPKSGLGFRKPKIRKQILNELKKEDPKSLNHEILNTFNTRKMNNSKSARDHIKEKNLSKQRKRMAKAVKKAKKW